MILSDNYDLNNLNADDKELHDTILNPYNLDVTNKTFPTHSKSLIDYITTDPRLKDPTIT